MPNTNEKDPLAALAEAAIRGYVRCPGCSRIYARRAARLGEREDRCHLQSCQTPASLMVPATVDDMASLPLGVTISVLYAP